MHRISTNAKRPLELPFQKKRKNIKAIVEESEEEVDEDEESDAPVFRFKEGDEVDIVWEGVLGQCRIQDNEPYIRLPDKHGGKKESKVGTFIQVLLLNVTKYARGIDDDGPVTFAPGHFLPFDPNEITEEETEVPLSDECRQLHSYFDGVEIFTVI